MDPEEEVDLVETREALLSEPPTTKEQNDAFWNSIRDETQAEAFLMEGALDNKNEAFMQLNHDAKIETLLDLSTLRPLLDEYVPMAQKKAFLLQHGDKLLEGVSMEHLVQVDNTASTTTTGRTFLGKDVAQAESLLTPEEQGKKYRLEMIPYERVERARQLYAAWNTHKAGRARYEEALFKQGKVDIRGAWITKDKK